MHHKLVIVSCTWNLYLILTCVGFDSDLHSDLPSDLHSNLHSDLHSNLLSDLPSDLHSNLPSDSHSNLHVISEMIH